MKGRLFDISFENVFSFRDKVTFSLQGIDSDVKPENYDFIGNEILLKTAVIYGANGSGKTNIIKFLDYFLRKLKESMDSDKNNGSFSFYEPFLFDKNKSRKNSTSSIIIRFILQVDEETRLYSYDVKFNQICFLQESLSYNVEGKEVNLFVKTTDPRSGIADVRYEQDNKPSYSQGFITPTRLHLNLFLSNPDKDMTPAAEFLAGIEFANSYNHEMLKHIWQDAKLWLKGSPRHLLTLEELLKHLDVQFQNLVVPEKLDASMEDLIFQHAVYNGDEMAGSISFSSIKESVGTSSVFLLGAKVLQAIEKGCPLFIDEMDSHFHGFITKYILTLFQDKRINRNGAQLILTTHNISLMDEKLLRKDQVWFTSKSKKGVSELYSLADFEQVRDDANFMEWYLESRFGGVPQVDFSLLKLFDDGQNN